MIYFKLLISSLLLACSACSASFAGEVANPDLCNEVKQFDESQLEVMHNSFRFGVKHSEQIGYTLAAIAWQESNAGKYKINAFDPSFGTYHLHLTTASNQEGISGQYRKNILAQRLVDDDEFAAKHAIMVIQFWHKKYGDDWEKVYASYNAGYNVSAGAAYAKKIQERIDTIKQCLSLNAI